MDSTPLRRTDGARNVWIVSAHFPPSNLTSVHRARLIANHLGDYGWTVTVVAAEPRFYEETPEPLLEKLVAPSVRVIRVKALSQGWARRMGWGDIGLRAWPGLYRALATAARDKGVDLVHITIPSNYQALLGRLLWERYRVPYLIDYIDPWVPESDLGARFPSKAWLAHGLARLLEPVAAGRAGGLAGVTEEYFAGVLRRNPRLRPVPTLAYQYGCASRDHEVARGLGVPARRLEKTGGEDLVVYAGALLPKAIEPMRGFLRALAVVNADGRRKRPLRLVCLGTGRSPNDTHGHQVVPLAREVGAEAWVREFPERHPYLEVLATLEQADGIVVVGSTEPHYSPSKLFQAVLARRPVLALLHQESEAVRILKESGAGTALTFGASLDARRLADECVKVLANWPEGGAPSVKWEVFRPFDAAVIAGRVARFYDEVIEYSEQRR